jgi:hypothetical protein
MLWQQSAPLRWEQWVCSRGCQMSCSFQIHAHLQRQSPHEEPCTPVCGHPLSSAPSGTRQSSNTPALAQKGGGGVGVHDSVSCANGNAGSATFLLFHAHANFTQCGGPTRIHLLAPTAPLLAVLSATSACTAHKLFAAACCIARTATTTSTAHLPFLRHPSRGQKTTGFRDSGISNNF